MRVMVIVNAAMERLAQVTNVTTGLAHPLDESRAKELFKSLHKHGINIEYNIIKGIALDLWWEDRNAGQIAKIADKIHNGGRVVIKHPRDWGEPTVKELIAEHGNT